MSDSSLSDVGILTFQKEPNVPPRLERRQQTGNSHFITFSCAGRNPYLSSTEAKATLQRVIEKTRKAYRFHLYGYVIMPEHVHLLLSEPELKPLNVTLAVIKREVSSLLTRSLSGYRDITISMYSRTQSASRSCDIFTEIQSPEASSSIRRTIPGPVFASTRYWSLIRSPSPKPCR
jgi:REP element-mobilizing transposase RayT